MVDRAKPLTQNQQTAALVEAISALNSAIELIGRRTGIDVTHLTNHADCLTAKVLDAVQPSTVMLVRESETETSGHVIPFNRDR